MTQTMMPDRAVLTDQILGQAVFTVTIDAPIDQIDIFEWLRTLPDQAYQRCETAEKDHCHLMSASDVLTPAGWSTCQVIWCLRAEPVDDRASKYTSMVTSHPAAGFMEFIARTGQAFDAAATARPGVSGDPCRPQAALHAPSIGRHAKGREAVI